MLLAALTILALTVLPPSPDLLLLRSGARISVSEVSVEGKTVTFRSGGVLYSIPLDEVDVEGTLSRTAVEREERKTEESTPRQRPLRVSPEEKERLLSDLAKSRGTPRPPVAVSPAPAHAAAARAEASIEVTEKSDEWFWRDRSRALEEALRQRQEELRLLVSREQRLQDEIRGLLSLGYKGDDFGLQVLQLADTRTQIEWAALEVQRAKRALDQFHDDARRQGILPGWLR